MCNQSLQSYQKAIAHSPNIYGQHHYLDQHLKAVASLTSYFLTKLSIEGLKDDGYYAGLWHDLGKYAPEWQEALQQAIEYEKKTGKRPKRLGVNHAFQGAKLALNYSPLVAMCIAGHHSGLSDKSNFRGKIQNDSSNIEEVKSQAEKDFLDDILTNDKSQISFKDKLQIELFIRLIFSALIDADRLDTASHVEGIDYQINNYPQISELKDKFESKRLEIINRSQAANEVNIVREEVYNYCVQSGECERGVYKLCAPTGAGKTFALQGFALNHAIKNQLNRIIYAAPFTTIIEQTAEVYRKMFGSDVVLEHHSAVGVDETNSDDINTVQLAVQNWDAPIIVTTNVQLLESLFSNHPSKCRKVHNIAGSVIVIDEVQALPANLMTPILSMLQNLVDYAGCSILLCTATQPAYEFIKNTNCQPKGVIPESKTTEHFAKLKRVEYIQIAEEWNWLDVRLDIEKRDLQQVLIVANTTNDAKNGFKEINLVYGENCYHLSSRMYPKHRLEILSKIQELLANNKSCYLISTQLIEAGVDLDFNHGYRVIAPLDSIVQSGGRINRNGKSNSLGTMTVFSLCDGKYPPGDYKECARMAKQIIDKGNDLNHFVTFDKYFRKKFEYKGTDKQRIQNLREEWAFESVAEKFKLIEDESESIFVAEETEAKQLLVKIEKKGFISKTDFKLCQKYMVKLRLPELEKRKSDWYESDVGLRVWCGEYNFKYGIE